MEDMVKAKWAVNFPTGAKVLVAEGDKVTEGEVVVEIKDQLVMEKKLDLTDKVVKEVDQGDVVKSKKLVSPVVGKVSKVEKERMVIEFGAEEFLGKEICGGKTWGQCDFRVKESFGDLKALDQGKVILVSRVDQIMILKAETIGVKGILVVEDGLSDEETIMSDLPILMFSAKDWERLILHAKKGPTKVWLSSAKNKLLVVR